MYRLLRATLDFLAPRACVMCGARLAIDEDVLCAACNWQLPRTYYAAKPYDNPMALPFYGQFPFVRGAGWFFYSSKDNVVKVIHRAKYYGDSALCQWLGRAAATEFLAYDFFAGIDVIVPMPLTRSRRRWRGYNQCYEIAKGVAAYTGLPIVANAVQRVHFKHSQTMASGAERRENVRDAFRLKRPAAIEGKHILLIDDVVTTGSTISSCGRAIATAGNVQITVMTIGVAR